MKQSLANDLSASSKFEIDVARTTSFMGDDLRVYATPWMVRDIEETCRLMIQEHLDEGEETVGAHVSVDHLGPTMVGMTVTVSATIREIDQRRITLDVEVHDGIDLVGKARHVRFVIDRERQKARLEKKRALLHP